jgi:uncharacterized protein YjbI with pentapeptide repeats
MMEPASKEDRVGKKMSIGNEHESRAETLCELQPDEHVTLASKSDQQESSLKNIDELERLAKLDDSQEPHSRPLSVDDLPGAIMRTNISLIELAEILDQHKIWVESGGDSGTKADLSGVNLASADLTGVNLQGATLTKVNLAGADLSMANLRGAHLVHADLRNATLLGTELRGANLMGATLYGAEGLWVGRLGGANLFDALLPESVAEFNTSNPIADATKVARVFYFSTLAVSVISCLLIIFTNDVRLLLNSSAIPFNHTGNLLPMSGFYLGAPLLVFALFLRFHFLLLRLWGSIAALPAVFPDGQTPERDGPWFLMGLIRKHFRWARDGRSPLAILETSISMALGYWVVPATLVLFWMRYLVRQDFRGTLLHVFLITAAVATATGLPNIVSRVLRPGELRIPKSKNFFRMVLLTTRAALITGGFLLIVSLGVHRGWPADSDSMPEHSSANARRWAAQLFQSVGYRPYADLTEAVISTPPAAGNWTDEGLANVDGARLNEMNMRFARAYRAFLVNAKLWRARMQGAYLSEADLRGANLREADLRSANFDRAQANRAVFVSANAAGAKFVSTDFRGADLSYGNFDNADLSNAKLAGTSLYGVTLRHARLLRADLSRTDLRDSKMDQATLTFANLADADLSSAKLGGANFAGAQLKRTILLDADLKNADFRGAFLGGALMREAEIDGANLAGADLRGASGLNATQICGAHWQGALLDNDLLSQVQAQCGTGVRVSAVTAAPPANSATTETIPPVAPNNTSPEAPKQPAPPATIAAAASPTAASAPPASAPKNSKKIAADSANAKAKPSDAPAKAKDTTADAANPKAKSSDAST